MNSEPEPGSLLLARIYTFTRTPWNNATVINAENANQIWSDVIVERGSSVLWLFPCAVSDLLFVLLRRYLPFDGLGRHSSRFGTDVIDQGIASG